MGMEHAVSPRLSKKVRLGLAATGALLELGLLGSSPALAHDDHHRHGGDGDREGGTYSQRGAPRCTTPAASDATVESVFGQFDTEGGLTFNQAGRIGLALYLSAPQVQQFSFDQLIAITQCAGVSLDTLASILADA